MVHSPDLLPGVHLPAGTSASSFLLSLLNQAQATFPDPLGGLKLPGDGAQLKGCFASLLVELEQLRVGSNHRGAIAAYLQRAVAERCTLRTETGDERPLTELGLESAPLEVEHVASQTTVGWVPRFTYRGRVWEGAGIEPLVNDLETRHRINRMTADALRRALKRLDARGALRLDGERFALLGAGAEIAPTRALLAAGAAVLWADVVPPPAEVHRLGGELYHARGRSDLLLHPDRVAATMAHFAATGPVHVGLFAYGPGQGREWRLGAAMNAAVRALPREAVRSLGLLISPTSPSVLSEDDASISEQRWLRRRSWQRALLATRTLRQRRVRPDLPAVSDTIVPLQGVSYQAAQWLEKTIATEAIALDNPDLPISANVAPVTETTSMQHPVFLAAFRGAPKFEVESFQPEVTRTLSTLLYIEDILGPHPAPSRHLHGGMFAVPFTLESAIRIAAVIGFTRRR